MVVEDGMIFMLFGWIKGTAQRTLCFFEVVAWGFFVFSPLKKRVVINGTLSLLVLSTR